jgi:hypothetical protein
MPVEQGRTAFAAFCGLGGLVRRYSVDGGTGRADDVGHDRKSMKTIPYLMAAMRWRHDLRQAV